MRIGFYHDAAGTRHAGGIAIYTQRMAIELSKSNDVYLYTQRGDLTAELADSDVTVVETPSFSGHGSRLLSAVVPFDSQLQSKLRMTMWSCRNGVIDHIEDHLDVLVTFQFLDDLLLSNLVDVPTVYVYHRLSSIGLGTLLRERFSQTDLTLANSDDTARRISEAFDYEVDEIVYPGVDGDRFHPDVEPVIESTDPVILFVGRLVEAKGVDDLLEAVSMIDGGQELHIVGRGDEDRLLERARALGLEDDVVVHGVVPHSELPAYYAGADVFCLPSHDESFGMANIEAMACDCPVVTTNLEGIKAYLDNGENGLLARPGDPQDLADKLSMLLDSSDLRAALGDQARTDVQEFTWDEQAKRLHAICHDGPAVPTDTDPEPIELPRPS